MPCERYWSALYLALELRPDSRRRSATLPLSSDSAPDSRSRALHVFRMIGNLG
jgi:hypothetical protein